MSSTTWNDRRSVLRPRGLPNLSSLLSFTSFTSFSSSPLTTRSEITFTALYKHTVSRVDVILQAISDLRRNNLGLPRPDLSKQIRTRKWQVSQPQMALQAASQMGFQMDFQTDFQTASPIANQMKTSNASLFPTFLTGRLINRSQSGPAAGPLPIPSIDEIGPQGVTTRDIIQGEGGIIECVLYVENCLALIPGAVIASANSEAEMATLETLRLDLHDCVARIRSLVDALEEQI